MQARAEEEYDIEGDEDEEDLVRHCCDGVEFVVDRSSPCVAVVVWPLGAMNVVSF